MRAYYDDTAGRNTRNILFFKNAKPFSGKQFKRRTIMNERSERKHLSVRIFFQGRFSAFNRPADSHTITEHISKNDFHTINISLFRAKKKTAPKMHYKNTSAGSLYFHQNRTRRLLQHSYQERLFSLPFQNDEFRTPASILCGATE